ncbi:MAG: LamG domain-containing protein [Nanoarchaeota archaeon]|nr:LamG domain-containing protein [Nanoarchaeota archaeon]
MLNKKTISSIVSVSLIVVISVISIIGFQTWFDSYSTTTYNKINIDNKIGNSLMIEGIYQNKLYVLSNYETYFNFLKISDRNGSVMCEIKNNKQTSWYDGTTMLFSFDNETVNETVILGFSKSLNYLTNYNSNFTNIDCINNGCLYFNGNAYITTNSGGAGFGNISLFAWIKPESNSSGEIFSYLVGRRGLTFTPIINISNKTVFFKDLNSSINENEWTFITATHNYNNNISKLYINGKLNKTGFYHEPITYFINSMGWNFKGLIDESGIYWEIISESEVKILYESQKAKFYSQLLPIGMKEIYTNDCNLKNNTVYNILVFTKDNKIEETVIKK